MGESTKRASWDKVGECTRESKGKCRKKLKIYTVHREVWGVQDRSKIKGIKKGRASAKKQGERGGALERYAVGQEKRWE